MASLSLTAFLISAIKAGLALRKAFAVSMPTPNLVSP